jgi:hypothetical protein
MSHPPQKKKWTAVMDLVYLYSGRVEESTPGFVYEVECAQNKSLEFEIDISQSQNIAAEGKSGTKISAIIGPYQRVLIAKLVQVDPKKRAVLKVKYNWRLIEVPKVSSEKVLRSRQSFLSSMEVIIS